MNREYKFSPLFSVFMNWNCYRTKEREIMFSIQKKCKLCYKYYRWYEKKNWRGEVVPPPVKTQVGIRRVPGPRGRLGPRRSAVSTQGWWEEWESSRAPPMGEAICTLLWGWRSERGRVLPAHSLGSSCSQSLWRGKPSFWLLLGTESYTISSSLTFWGLGRHE